MPTIIKWCDDPTMASTLGVFFAENVSEDYISHSELQGLRARDVGSWMPGLEQILTGEIETRIRNARERVADGYELVMTAWDDESLVGLSLVSLFPKAPVPYGVIEDVVVAQRHRSH